MNCFLLFLEIACFVTVITSVTDKETNSIVVDKNLCNVTVRYQEESEKKYTYTYSEPYTAWCSTFPFRCTKHRVKDRVEVQKIIEFKNKTVYECCEGYQNVSGRCVSLCKSGCVNGECISPNNCSCFGGWKGDNCSEECKESSYGKECNKICLCENGGTCDKINGTCKCLPGFTGEYCETVCSGHSVGKECENVCKCDNGGVCNATAKSCECLDGYFGKRCNHKCSVGSFGKDCKNTCKCKMANTEVCNHMSGDCFCKSGWRGDHCEKMCEDKTWGPLCKNQCDCGPNGTCHRVTGKCTCSPGWHGPKCEKKCPVGYFEQDCMMKCPYCLHEPGTCHHETGWCNCPDGSTGPSCDLECPEGKYGRNCEYLCLCTSNSTCDPITGECRCLPGWIGLECQFPCPEGKYGDNCNFTCDCPDKISCNRFDGYCNCDETDDDPQCLKGPLIQGFEDKSMIPVIMILAFVVFGVLFFLILIVKIIFKRKKNSTAAKILNEDGLSSINNGDSSDSDVKKFTNPVYEAMDESIRSQIKSVAEAQTFENSSSDVNYFKVDFKIPDCDEAKIPSNISQENSKTESNFSKEPQEANFRRLSIESSNVKYYNTVLNSATLENPFQKSSIYSNVDLKEEHHYEFPSSVHHRI